MSGTACFTSYTAGGFGPAQQIGLHERVIHLAGQGAHVLLSNSVAPEIEALYGDNAAARGAGLHARKVPARRAINSRGTGRGTVLEYVITNVIPVPAPADGASGGGPGTATRRPVRVN